MRDVLIQGPEIHGTFTDGRTFQTYAPSDPTLIERLNKKGVSITARPQSDNVSSLISWLPFVALIGVCIFLWRRMPTRLLPEAHSPMNDRAQCQKIDSSRTLRTCWHSKKQSCCA